MNPFFRLFCFLTMVTGVVTAAHPQSCQPLFPYDTLVVGVSGSGMSLWATNTADVYAASLSNTPWATVTPAAGGRIDLRIIESNETVAARIGRIYIDRDSCRDSILLIQPGKTCEQGIDGTEGKRFFVGFSENINSNPQLNLIMTSSQDASGTITLPRGTYSATFSVPANAVNTVALSPAQPFLMSTGETVDNKGLLVEADKKISLYASNSESKSSDATNILPIEALGDES